MNGSHSTLPAQLSNQTRKLQMKITPSERGPIRLVKFDQIKATEPAPNQVIDLSDDDDDNILNTKHEGQHYTKESDLHLNKKSNNITQQQQSSIFDTENEFEVKIINDFTSSMTGELYQICDQFSYIKMKYKCGENHCFTFHSMKDAFKFYNEFNERRIQGEPLVVMFPVEKDKSLAK